MMAVLHHPAFRLRPSLGQFAKSGSWEAAWSFDASELPDSEAVRSYLAGAPEIGFEAFFDEAFFGIRFAGEPPMVESLALGCLTALNTATCGEDLFRHLLGEHACDKPGDELAFAEVGAVNGWASTGPFKVANPRAALDDFDGFWLAITQTQLGQNTCHRKAIEFVYRNPIHHWFALPVSYPTPPFRLSQMLLRQALAVAAGIEDPSPGGSPGKLTF